MAHILMISNCFSPNVGGVETHLDDLCDFLSSRNHRVTVITYLPFTTKATAPKRETRGNVTLLRSWIPGHNWYPRLEKIPAGPFFYMAPGLTLRTVAFLLKHRNDVDVIHAQGIVSAFAGRVAAGLFRKKCLMSTHAVYDLGLKPAMAKAFRAILSSYDLILPLAERSEEELVALGLPREKMRRYTYWVNQDVFRPLSKEACKAARGWSGRFVILFVGRMIPIKGMDLLVQASRHLPGQVLFAFAGTGPEEEKIRQACEGSPSLTFLGALPNRDLPEVFNAADLLAVPSMYSEGFARVNLEALSCGLPVLASQMGCLPEIIDETVGDLVPPKPEAFAEKIEGYLAHPEILAAKAQACRPYADRRYGLSNAEKIASCYREVLQ